MLQPCHNGGLGSYRPVFQAECGLGCGSIALHKIQYGVFVASYYAKQLPGAVVGPIDVHQL